MPENSDDKSVKISMIYIDTKSIIDSIDDIIVTTG